jgi:tetratricopeptide (TPR) repeat protein
MTRRGLLVALLLVTGAAVAAADDLDTTYQSLKDAVSKKDAAEVKKLAADTCALARKEESSALPEGVDAEAWKQHIANVKEIEVYSEYALYATAVQSEPATTVDLLATLEQQNPKSKYLDEGYGPYFLALSKTGGSAKIHGIAEKALVNFPENDDLLLVLADHAWAARQVDSALSYANRVIAAVNKHAKPEGYSAADWERKRNGSLSRAYWMAGLIYGDKGRYVDADKNLKAALPLITGNAAMMGPALYSLGLANYHLGKMTNSKAKVLEGAKYCQQASAVQWANAQQAWHDSQVIKREGDAMR